MLSKATGYAIQMLTWLAKRYDVKESNKLYFVHQIAESLSIPQNFLSKIAVILSKKKIISAQKGPKGGICLAKHPEKITLYDIAQIFDDDITKNKCLIGKPTCSDNTNCPIHKFWKHERLKLIEQLKDINIMDLAKQSD